MQGPKQILIAIIFISALLGSQTAHSASCVLGPIQTVGGGSYPSITNWDGTAGDMSAPGPHNLCQATNYIGTAHGGNEVFADYDDCGALGEGDVSPNGACVKSVWANCGGNLSCASQCSVGMHPCAAPTVNGTCGTADGGSFPSAPTTNLCGLGDGVATPAPSGTGPWTWTCGGSGGGLASGNCTATQTVAINGVCGTANNVSTATAPTNPNLCSAGTDTAVTNSSNTWNWNCNGIGGGTNATCSAPEQINGTCGPANGSSVYTAPSSGLCATGNSTSVTGSGPFDWDCNGISGGTDTSCSANLAINGVCGPAHGAFSASAPSSGLCSAGSAGAVGGTGPFTWTCGGLNGGTSIACSSQVVVQGTCGTANNVVTATAPAAGLCATGTATAVTGSGPWTWSCTGSGGGTNSTCTAPTPPPPPTFGGACPT